jgi:hypothetical protein
MVTSFSGTPGQGYLCKFIRLELLSVFYKKFIYYSQLMKWNIIFFIILFSIDESQAGCQAPGHGFLEHKLRESWSTDALENELKEVVSDPRNLSLREEIKGLDRRSKFARRIEKEELYSEVHKKFIQMIEVTNRSDEIKNFPTVGASATFLSTDESISIEARNLSNEDLDVLPVTILEKLEPKVKIKYYYPYDKFDYFLTYNNRELPLEKAFNKIQSDFEDACEDRVLENRRILRSREQSYPGINGQSSVSGQ